MLWSCISCILCWFLVFAILQSTEILDVCDRFRTSSQTRTSLTRLDGAVLESRVGKTTEIELRWKDCSHKCKPNTTELLNCIGSFIEAPSGLETIHQFAETNLKKGSRQPESALWALRGRAAVIKIILRSNTSNLICASPPFATFLALSLSLSVPLSLSHALQLFDGQPLAEAYWPVLTPFFIL